jgi:hypothetical protein
MIFLEMTFKGLIVHVVLLLAVVRAPVTDMAAFMLLTAMGVQLVVTIEALSAETTLRMPFETALVDGTGLVITILFVLSQLRVCK